MQRVRIGITGLACVFLVVLLAAAIVGFRSEDNAGGNGASQLTAPGTENAASEPKDPLAELGVAPGGTTASPSAGKSR